MEVELPETKEGCVCVGGVSVVYAWGFGNMVFQVYLLKKIRDLG